MTDRRKMTPEQTKRLVANLRVLDGTALEPMADRPNYPARVVVFLIAMLFAVYIGAGLATVTVWLGLWTPTMEVME